MQSKATTVQQYLAELPLERREALSAVRAVILKNLDQDYAEGMQYGMIGYYVPHSIFPAGYHCDPRQPLPFAGLASQMNHMSLYLCSVYCGCDGAEETGEARWFKQAWIQAGKKLDMGKACIRFRSLDGVPLDVVGEAFRRVPVKKYIKHYESAILVMNKQAAARAAAKKAGTGTPSRGPKTTTTKRPKAAAKKK